MLATSNAQLAVLVKADAAQLLVGIANGALCAGHVQVRAGSRCTDNKTARNRDTPQQPFTQPPATEGNRGTAAAHATPGNNNKVKHGASRAPCSWSGALLVSPAVHAWISFLAYMNPLVQV